jgi:WD40 repeat protein
MRRILSILCKPVVLLMLFLAWLGLFYWLGEMRAWSKYEFDTDITFVSGGSGGWRKAEIHALADDGSRAVVITSQTVSMPSYVTQVWEARTGKNITPDLSEDKPCVEILSIMFGSHEQANRFAHHLTQLRENALGEWQKKVSLEDAKIYWTPVICGSSRDGRYFCYGSDHGHACYDGEPPLLEIRNVNSIAVDDVVTGKQIAVLPGVEKDWHTNSDKLLAISPDGKVAASSIWHDLRTGEQSHLILWDLGTSQKRADLDVEIPIWGLDDDDVTMQFSQDSRFLFACAHRRQTWWWDASSGERRGHVLEGSDMALLDGGRVLVTNAYEVHYADENDNVGIHSNKLTFWDPESALPIGTMHPLHGDRGDTGDWHLASPGVGPHFVVEFDYDETLPLPAPKRNRLMKFLFPRQVADDPSKVLLHDGIERREVADLPGRTATFSPNGHWLATIDGDGIVRVWELPLRRPWLRIFGYATSATLACVLLFLLARWPFRRAGSV